MAAVYFVGTHSQNFLGQMTRPDHLRMRELPTVKKFVRL